METVVPAKKIEASSFNFYCISGLSRSEYEWPHSHSCLCDAAGYGIRSGPSVKKEWNSIKKDVQRFCGLYGRVIQWERCLRDIDISRRFFSQLKPTHLKFRKFGVKVTRIMIEAYRIKHFFISGTWFYGNICWFCYPARFDFSFSFTFKF